MSAANRLEKSPRWEKSVEKFEEGIVAILAILLVIIILIILLVVVYLFGSKLVPFLSAVGDIGDIQPAALKSFSGVLLVLLGLELLDTVKVYFHGATRAGDRSSITLSP